MKKPFNIQTLIRPSIQKLVPYSSARNEYEGSEGIFLDANENPFNTGLNRYPDPVHTTLKKAISASRHVSENNLLLGNGSDEVIDLLFRTVCEPGKHTCITLPPTYGMYSVSAAINDVEVVEVPLTENFQPVTEKILQHITSETRIIFFCSPNNPSGNCLAENSIKEILNRFQGLVVIDEAYIDFSTQTSWLTYLTEYPNLVVLQTFSKAWGLAGIRLGMLFANQELIRALHKVKPPYNVNALTQRIALQALENTAQTHSWIQAVISQRDVVKSVLSTLSFVEKVYPSDANFLLVKCKRAAEVFAFLKQEKIIVRNRSQVPGCEGCLRISIGTMEENIQLLEKLKQFDEQENHPEI